MTALNKGGFAQISSLSCAPGWCGAGGFYTDADQAFHLFVVSGE